MSNARLQMALSALFFTLAQTCVKFVSAIPAHEIVWLRGFVSGALTLAILRHQRVSPLGHNRRMLILRGLLGTLAMVLYFWTIQNVPLASAMTLHYTYPIMTVLLTAILLHEKPKVMQQVCLAGAFIGVCLIKGFDSKITAFCLAISLISALMDAATFTIVRKLRTQDHALVVVFYLPLVSIVVLSPFVLSNFIVPTAFETLIILAIGVFAQAGQYCVTRAYQLGEPAAIANLCYLAPVVGLIFGWLFWNETISTAALQGLLLIVGCALLSGIQKGKIPAREVSRTRV